MDDIAAKIADLLDNDDAMKQMASVLAALNTPGDVPPPPPDPPQSEQAGPDIGALLGMLGAMGGSSEAPPRENHSQNPDSGPDLSALLGMLGSMGGNEPPPEPRSSQSQSSGPDLSALLGMLGGMGSSEPPPTESRRANPGGGAGAGPDISSLLGMLGGIGGGSRSQSAAPGIDPNMIGALGRAMGVMRENDHNIELLKALRPYLNDHRQEKVDEAVKVLRMLKLLPILQESGILRGNLF